MPETRSVRAPRRTLVAALGCLLALGGWLTAAPAASAVSAATTLHVTSCLDDGGTTTLRALIGSAGLGATIVFDQNCTGANAIVLTTGTLTLTQNVTIDGVGATVTVDGGCAACGAVGVAGGVTVFKVNNGVTATLSHLTIQHGNSGIAFLTYGGGISNSGTLILTRSTLTANAADEGGGITNLGTLTAVDTTFSGNTAKTGGAIRNDGPLTLTNCTLSGNVAVNGPGGVAASTGPTLTNTIVAGNTDQNPASTLISDFQGPLAAGSANSLIGIYGGPGNGINGNQFGTVANPINPLLGTLANNGGPTRTMALLPGSPAVDAGNDAVCASMTPPGAAVGGKDQRGIARPQGTHCDIGAFEALLTPLPPPKPPGGGTGSPSPLPTMRPPGTTGGPTPNPLPAPRR